MFARLAQTILSLFTAPISPAFNRLHIASAISAVRIPHQCLRNIVIAQSGIGIDVGRGAER